METLLMTTKQDIRDWLNGSCEADFMIVVWDIFEFDNYPVFCTHEDFEETHAKYDGKNMQRVMEVYDLSIDHEAQLNEQHAFHPPKTNV